jgi:chondroitin synthase
MKSAEYKIIEQAARAYQDPYHLKVSVVIAHYNVHDLLSRCIAGLSAQTYPHDLIEVIISDDGSDHTPREAELAFAEVLNLTIISQPRLGFRAATARNRAIERASGDVIICIDSDVIPTQNLIEAHMRFFHVSRHVVTVGPRKFVDVSGIEPVEVPSKLPSLRFYPDVPSASNHGFQLDGRNPFFEHFSSERKPYWFFYTCNVGFTREACSRVGLFDCRFDGHWGYEDVEFGYRLFLDGNVFMFTPDAVALHQESRILSQEQRTADGDINLAKLIAKWPELEDEEPNIFPEH